MNTTKRPDPRATAVQLLLRSQSPHVSLDRLMEEALRSPFDQRDRHLLHALVYGVLRNRLRLDTRITQLLHRHPKRLAPELLWILRIGLFQILDMDRIPQRAAVHTAVELTRKMGLPWAAGMVNAVLRRAIRETADTSSPPFSSDPVHGLAVQYSFPEWLIERWIARLGHEATHALCAAFNRIPPLTIRTNTLRIDRSELMQAFSDVAEHIEQTAFSPDGIRLIRPHKPVFDLPGFSEGFFQVQDEAAQLVGLLVDARPNMHVLDACAGMGGKTGHLAQTMRNEGNILAVDASAEKLGMLENEMKRLKVDIVHCRAWDWRTDFPPEMKDRFDRILLDAPCSGLGVLGRNPDIRWRPDRTDLKPFAERQILLIEHTISLLKPDGRLVYAVCSMEPEETDDVIDAVLKRNPFLRRMEATDDTSKTPLKAFWRDGALRTFPHVDGMDGFFACILCKDCKDQSA